LPRLPNGKINRSLLPGVSYSKQTFSPVTETEMQRFEFWSIGLPGGTFGITDNFVAVGGHSLKAIQLLQDLNSRYLLKLEFNFILEFGTVSEQAEKIDQIVKLNEISDSKERSGESLDDSTLVFEI